MDYEGARMIHKPRETSMQRIASCRVLEEEVLWIRYEANYDDTGYQLPATFGTRRPRWKSRSKEIQTQIMGFMTLHSASAWGLQDPFATQLYTIVDWLEV